MAAGTSRRHGDFAVTLLVPLDLPDGWVLVVAEVHEEDGDTCTCASATLQWSQGDASGRPVEPTGFDTPPLIEVTVVDRACKWVDDEMRVRGGSLVRVGSRSRTLIRDPAGSRCLAERAPAAPACRPAACGRRAAACPQGWRGGAVAMIPGVLIAYGLLAAPVVAAVLWLGRWPLVLAGVVVAVVQLGALQRSQRFGARLWRSVGVGRRGRRERAVEQLHVLSAVAGLVLLVWAVVDRV